MVDNCSVHFKCENSELQNQPLDKLGVLMIVLSLYWYDLNPVELLFSDLLIRLKVERSIYNSPLSNNLYICIAREMLNFLINDVIIFSKECSYKSLIKFN